MWIICVYALNVVIGEAVVIVCGLYLDRVVPATSLSISLTFFFAVLWLGWVLAVRWTQPKIQADSAVASNP
jgi:hypothetical protein